MKYKIVSALFGMALIAVCSMERAEAQTIKRAGIKGGLNVSNLYIDDIHDEDARIGTNLGFYGQVLSNDAAALQLELLYSTKGAEAMYTAGTLSQKVKYNLNYIDLPVLAALKLGKSAEIHLGGYASYLLNANISYSGDLANGTDEVDKDHLKSYDYGLSGGVGFNFGAVQVGGRYNYGLVKIADSDGARAVIGDSKNSNAQLYIAFNLLK
ncbi:MAG: PorT family protein [Cyclobacteriaceae bacterium]|nr:PorT family protein [Cyclobacteriaceae bacterium]